MVVSVPSRPAALFAGGPEFPTHSAGFQRPFSLGRLIQRCRSLEAVVSVAVRILDDLINSLLYGLPAIRLGQHLSRTFGISERKVKPEDEPATPFFAVFRGVTMRSIASCRVPGFSRSSARACYRWRFKCCLYHRQALRWRTNQSPRIHWITSSFLHGRFPSSTPFY